MYCSDVAKMLETPIFHVNGDDPEAVVFVTRLALAYRQRFRKDVVIDLVCYRRHGHNEADEPAATQPMMYQVIRKHPTTRKLYADKLVAQGVLTDADAADMTESYRQGLDEGTPAGARLARHDRQQVHRRLEQVSRQRLDRAREGRRQHGAPQGARRTHREVPRRTSRCIRASRRSWPIA